MIAKSAVRSILIFTTFVAFNLAELWAQCAMCKGQLETADDRNVAQAVNFGILYLLALPFVLIGVIGISWYLRNKKAQREAEQRAAARLDDPADIDTLRRDHPLSDN